MVVSNDGWYTSVRNTVAQDRNIWVAVVKSFSATAVSPLVDGWKTANWPAAVLIPGIPDNA
jgi:hypothetical protein